MAHYRLYIEASLSSDLPIAELEEKLDVCLLKYGVSDIIPAWEKQQALLEGYELHHYPEFRVEEDFDYEDEDEDNIT